MARYYIGIDPGVKTGFAVWDKKQGRLLRVGTLTIVGAMIEVMELRDRMDGEVVIIFEDARLRKWLPQEKNVSEYRGRLMGAGSVKRDCEIWETFCKKEQIDFQALPPRKGATKWDAEYFKKVTGWKGRTSNHARDAAILVFNRI